MNREGINEFIDVVFGPNTVRVQHPKWVSLHCPLAPWRHASGVDKSPSAGISVRDDDHSIFNCYSCHSKFPIATLLRVYGDYTGDDWEEYAETLDEDEMLGPPAPEWEKRQSEIDTPLIMLPESHVDLYEPLPDEGHRYLRKRQVSVEVAQRLGIVIDPEDSEGEERLLFPVRGLDGALYGFTGRATEDDARLRVRDYFGLQKRKLLLGAHLIPEDAKYISLVEGLFDYARLSMWGVNPLAFMSSTLTDWQVELVKDIGLPVYFFHDNDEVNEQGFSPGLDARDRAVEALCQYVPIFTVEYPTRMLRHRRTGAYRHLKDPAELLESEVMQMIANAELA